MKLHCSRSREEGHTLLEVAVVLSMALLIMQGVFNVMFHWERLFTEQVKHFTLDQSAERILHRLAEEIRASDPTTILPIVVSNSSTIQFQRVTGFSGGVATLRGRRSPSASPWRPGRPTASTRTGTVSRMTATSP